MRPRATARRRYEWGYLYSFVRPTTGELVNVVGNTVSTPAMSEVLAHFAKEAGAGPDRRVVVVWDGAGWHTGRGLVVPEGIHLIALPPYSPELQPAERIWPLVHEATANRDFRDLDELIQVVSDRCNELDSDRRRLRKLTRYWWWPDDVDSSAD
ncbi:MAG: transposase [Alphaproteobacteria bacterium]|nr:transposase [Alphaproteobacteria bacterium]